MGNQADKTRLEHIEEILTTLRDIRSRLEPTFLERISEILDTNAESPSEIKIDRARNTQFVMDFLNSPEGAHLKDKIRSCLK